MVSLLFQIHLPTSLASCCNHRDPGPDTHKQQMEPSTIFWLPLAGEMGISRTERKTSSTDTDVRHLENVSFLFLSSSSPGPPVAHVSLELGYEARVNLILLLPSTQQHTQLLEFLLQFLLFSNSHTHTHTILFYCVCICVHSITHTS